MEKCLTAIERLDTAAFENSLMQALMTLGNSAVIDDVLEPLLRRIDQLWESGNLRIGQEHFASAGIRAFLMYLVRSLARQADGPMIVITTPAGQLHEIGALLVSATAAARGWAPLYLGPNLPATEIAAALECTGAKTLGLSIVYPAGDPCTAKDLNLLAEILPSHTEVLVGGRAAKSYMRPLSKMAAFHINSMAMLRSHLGIFHTRSSVNNLSINSTHLETIPKPNGISPSSLQGAKNL